MRRVGRVVPADQEEHADAVACQRIEHRRALVVGELVARRAERGRGGAAHAVERGAALPAQVHEILAQHAADAEARPVDGVDALLFQRLVHDADQRAVDHGGTAARLCHQQARHAFLLVV